MADLSVSPATFDPIELWKALEREEEMVPPIKNKIAECEHRYGGTMEAQVFISRSVQLVVHDASGAIGRALPAAACGRRKITGSPVLIDSQMRANLAAGLVGQHIHGLLR